MTAPLDSCKHVVMKAIRRSLCSHNAARRGGGGTTEQAEVPVFNVRRAECAQNNTSIF
jgi:hypothetical protein